MTNWPEHGWVSKQRQKYLKIWTGGELQPRERSWSWWVELVAVTLLRRRRIPRKTPAWLAQVSSYLAGENCFNQGGGKSCRPSRRGAGGGYQTMARIEKRIRLDVSKRLPRHHHRNPQICHPRGGEAAGFLLGGHLVGLLQHLLRCSWALWPAWLALRVLGNCRVSSPNW